MSLEPRAFCGCLRQGVGGGLQKLPANRVRLFPTRRANAVLPDLSSATALKRRRYLDQRFARTRKFRYWHLAKLQLEGDPAGYIGACTL